MAHGAGVSAPQLSLALDGTAEACSEAALRSAFRSLSISHRVSFEEAMSSAAWRICLRNLAHARLRCAASG